MTTVSEVMAMADVWFDSHPNDRHDTRKEFEAKITALVADLDGAVMANRCNKEVLQRWADRAEKAEAERARLKAENEALRNQIKQAERNAKEDARANSVERGWQERQGDDYGSY